MKVKFKKLVPNATTPSYAKDGDAGLDLTALSVAVKNDYNEYGTGIAVEIPKGYVGLLFPRSSVTKKTLMLKNSIGVIDSGYRGEIMLRFHVTSSNYLPDMLYKSGDKVGQLLIIPIPTIELEEVEELSDSERGEGGFGSTDKK